MQLLGSKETLDGCDAVYCLCLPSHIVYYLDMYQIQVQ